MDSRNRWLRLKDIVGDKKAGIPAIVPVSKSTWWAWVASGKAPQPVKLGERVTVWAESAILAFCNKEG